jgi:hypothetical protein
MSATLVHDLKEHLHLCEELLQLLARENQSLHDPAQPSQFETSQARKQFLPKIGDSLQALRNQREAWCALTASDRERCPEVTSLIHRTQEAIMKVLVLDRENEQALLRRGLVPARHLPSVSRQRPHFVADLYRRAGLASA